MATKTKNNKVQAHLQLPLHRVDWQKIWEPEETEYEVMEKGNKVKKASLKYSYVAIFDKDTDLSKLKKLVKDVVDKEFPDGYETDDVRSPFRYGFKEKRKGDEFGFAKPHDLVKYPQYKDKITCTLSTTRIQPGVVIPKKDATGKWLPLTDQAKLYNGCYCVATVNCYISDYQGNINIKFGLKNIMVMKDGEPLKGGGVAAENDFEEINEDDWGTDNSDEMDEDDINMDDM